MSWLYALEKVRHAAPWLASFFSILTNLGGEAVFLALALIVLWCVNKREGYYILSVAFLGTVINQVLKITFRIPRPWDRDPSFTIWEPARAEATGYSFPSGHTQNVTGSFGGLLLWNRRNRLFQILFPILIAAVMFSRMFLGVHTPLDVFVSFAIALVLIFSCYLFFKTERKSSVLLLWMLALAVVAIAFVLFSECASFIKEADETNLFLTRKSAWSLLGAMFAMVMVVWLEPKYVNYSTEASGWGQICKTVLGILAVLFVKEGLKAVFAALFGSLLFLHAIRYFAVVFVAGFLWPMTFRFFSAFGGSKSKTEC